MPTFSAAVFDTTLKDDKCESQQTKAKKHSLVSMILVEVEDTSFCCGFTAMVLVWKYGERKGYESWKGLNIVVWIFYVNFALNLACSFSSSLYKVIISPSHKTPFYICILLSKVKSFSLFSPNQDQSQITKSYLLTKPTVIFPLLTKPRLNIKRNFSCLDHKYGGIFFSTHFISLFLFNNLYLKCNV